MNFNLKEAGASFRGTPSEYKERTVSPSKVKGNALETRLVVETFKVDTYKVVENHTDAYTVID